MNAEWALGELDKFLQFTEMRMVTYENVAGSWEQAAAPDELIVIQTPVTEKILDRVTPDWREYVSSETTHGSRWRPLRNAVLRCRTVLAREAELQMNLGDSAPELSASDFHPWVWGGASSLWQSGHFVQAVDGAIKKLNAETQNKVGRRDIGETVLFQQSFSPNPAQARKPRLHRIPREDSDTYRSLQRGAMAFAEGIFAGIRNPLAHEAEHDLSEQQAPEYLAALSVLARWVDKAEVETAESIP